MVRRFNRFCSWVSITINASSGLRSIKIGRRSVNVKESSITTREGRRARDPFVNAASNERSPLGVNSRPLKSYTDWASANPMAARSTYGDVLISFGYTIQTAGGAGPPGVTAKGRMNTITRRIDSTRRRMKRDRLSVK